MRKNGRNVSAIYPEEKEGRTKDANKKLKSQIRNLKKTIKQLESSNHTLLRAYDKSCDFIQHELADKSLKQILTMVDNHEYKETKKGREKKTKKIEAEEALLHHKCPECGNMDGEGYSLRNIGIIKIESCTCGYKKRKANPDEGIKRS